MPRPATCLRVINDVLDISKIEAEKLVLEAADFSLEDVLHDATAMVQQRMQDKGLALAIDADLQVGRLHGDAGRLGQGLLNYLANAVKFTERGRVVLSARVLESTDTDVLLRFEVTDTGIGIAADQPATAVCDLRAGRQLDDPAFRRDRTGPGDHAQAGPDDGRVMRAPPAPKAWAARSG